MPEHHRTIVPDALDIEHQIFHARLTETLTPGQSAAAVRVMPLPDGTFADTSITLTVHDNYDTFGAGTKYGQNFGLSGELFKVRRNPTTNKDECVGSQGLRRLGSPDSAIDADSSGTVSILHSPGSASCTGVDSGANVTACAFVDVPAQETVFLSYQPDLKNWFVIAAAMGTAMTLIGKPQDTHTTGSTATYNVWEWHAGSTRAKSPSQTVTGYQETGHPLLSGNLCQLTLMCTSDGSVKYISQVHPMQDCEQGDEFTFGAPGTPLSISSGAITVTRSYHIVDTESDAATDNLDTINGGTDGKFLMLQSEHADRHVVVRDNIGNIRMPANFTLSHPLDKLILTYDGTNSVWTRWAQSNIEN